MKEKSFLPTKNYSVDSNDHFSRLGPNGTRRRGWNRRNRWDRYPIYETPYFSGYNFPYNLPYERPEVNNYIIKASPPAENKSEKIGNKQLILLSVIGILTLLLILRSPRLL